MLIQKSGHIGAVLLKNIVKGHDDAVFNRSLRAAGIVDPTVLNNIRIITGGTKNIEGLGGLADWRMLEFDFCVCCFLPHFGDFCITKILNKLAGIGIEIHPIGQLIRLGAFFFTALRR